jgi:hypothetical protein
VHLGSLALVATDWTILGVGIIGAGSALVAGSRAVRLQLRAAARHESKDRRRNAYLAALAEADRLMSFVSGIAEHGRHSALAAPEIGPFLEARTSVELLAPGKVWSEMEPFLRAVTLWTNYSTDRPGRADPEVEHRILQSLEEVGGSDAAGVVRLRVRFLKAAQADTS